jgi:hypothetical protein
MSIDVASAMLYLGATDISIPGWVPLRWERNYLSFDIAKVSSPLGFSRRIKGRVREMEEQNDKAPNALLRMNPDLVADELDKQISGPDALSPGECHTLAEGAGFKAVSAAADGSLDSARAWSEISVRIYEALASRPDMNPQKKERFLESAMRVRSELIGRFGALPGDNLRDAGKLRDWFLDRLVWDIETARRKAADWKALALPEIQALRNLKNRLRTLHPAIPSAELGGDGRIREWLDLEKDLP